MKFYLAQASYTQEAWNACVKNPQDRTEGVRSLIESLGGRLHSFYYALGEHDLVVLFEVPDDKVAAAFSLAARAPGHLSEVRTTALLTPSELIESLRMAGGQSYKAPEGFRQGG